MSFSYPLREAKIAYTSLLSSPPTSFIEPLKICIPSCAPFPMSLLTLKSMHLRTSAFLRKTSIYAEAKTIGDLPPMGKRAFASNTCSQIIFRVTRERGYLHESIIILDTEIKSEMCQIYIRRGGNMLRLSSI